MLDVKFIRENPEKVKKACADKNILVDVDKFLELDVKKRQTMIYLEGLKAQKNKLGRDNIEEAKALKQKIQEAEPQLEEIEKEAYQLLRKIPNIPFDDVIVGKDDSQNQVLRQVGKLTKLDFTPKEHFELGEALDIIDLERAAKIAGSRFYFLKNE